MKQSIATGAEVGAAIGGLIKSILMLAVTLVAIGLAIYLAIQGRWGAAALVFFIGEPVLLFLADIATSVLVALFAGAGAAVGAATPSRRSESQ